MRKFFALTVATLAFAGLAYADSAMGGARDTDMQNRPTAGNPGTSVSGAMNMDTTMPSQTGMVMSPQMVMNRIHAINQEEIHAGKMAKKNGTQAIKGYAETLIKDHEQADKDLKTLAKNEKLDITDPDKVTWPSDVQQKMQQDQAMMDQLKNMKGVDFDKQFLTMMSDGHRDALNYLKMVDASTQDDQLKTFVDKIQPTIEQHKKMADDLQKHVGERVQGRR